MNKLKQLLLAALLATPLMAAPVAAEMNIVVVDMQGAFTSSKPFQKYQKELADHFGKQRNAVKKQEKKFKEAIAKAQKDEATMSQSEKQQRALELQRMQQDLELAGKQQMMAERAYEQESGKLVALQKQLQEAVQQVTKDGGYDLVLRREAVLFVKSDKNDITKEVVERFNQIAR